jgi:hypothetical protein
LFLAKLLNNYKQEEFFLRTSRNFDLQRLRTACVQREAGLMNMHSVAGYNSDAQCTAFLSHRLTAKILRRAFIYYAGDVDCCYKSPANQSSFSICDFKAFN